MVADSTASCFTSVINTINTESPNLCYGLGPLPKSCCFNFFNETATKASFCISRILTKRGKAFTDGSLIKECIIHTVEDICPEKNDNFNNINFSAKSYS